MAAKFGTKSTTEDVLAGIELQGKRTGPLHQRAQLRIARRQILHRLDRVEGKLPAPPVMNHRLKFIVPAGPSLAGRRILAAISSRQGSEEREAGAATWPERQLCVEFESGSYRPAGSRSAQS